MIDSKNNLERGSSRPMAIRESGGKHSPTAVRLRLLRSAIYGENATAFAARIGISVQRLANMENGFPLSLDVAKKIRASVPGLTTDWLFFADERALPVDMVTKLRATAAQLPEADRAALGSA
jgi:hypothetical protein